LRFTIATRLQTSPQEGVWAQVKTLCWVVGRIASTGTGSSIQEKLIRNDRAIDFKRRVALFRG
jgi:hypothetical protein